MWVKGTCNLFIFHDYWMAECEAVHVGHQCSWLCCTDLVVWLSGSLVQLWHTLVFKDIGVTQRHPPCWHTLVFKATGVTQRHPPVDTSWCSRPLVLHKGILLLTDGVQGHWCYTKASPCWYTLVFKATAVLHREGGGLVAIIPLLTHLGFKATAVLHSGGVGCNHPPVDTPWFQGHGSVTQRGGWLQSSPCWHTLMFKATVVWGVWWTQGGLDEHKGGLVNLLQRCELWSVDWFLSVLLLIHSFLAFCQLVWNCTFLSTY